jgi:phytoene dehydrogenase-like protein
LTHYDTIIIGAGHNGLVCAAYLARSGQKVLLLEAADTLGGLAATREFHPGFQASVAHSVTHFSTKVIKDLELTKHGCSFEAPMAQIGLNESGEHVVIQGSSVTGVSDNDKAAYTKYRQQMIKFASVLKSAWLKTMPRIGNNSLAEMVTFGQTGLKLRLLGKEGMGEFLRVASLPARDLMDENFENDILKAMLSWDGLIGSKMAPRSPNSTVLSMFLRMSGEHDGDHVVPKGGMKSLIGALEASAKASGVDIRTATKVARIDIEADETGLSASGVVLEDGETISATRIVSATDPKRTFLDLVGPRNLEIEFTNRINRMRTKGYVAKLHLALDGLPKFTGVDSPDGRMIIAPELDSLEFAYDDSKYGEASEHPVMEIMVPSMNDASLAPSGQHVLSAHVMYVPYDRKGGWTDEARDALSERVIDTLERYAPGIRGQIVHREMLTPFDLEQTHNVTGGHWHHTEFSMDQILMMRPTYEAAQYSTPIPGLYLCSAGSHPGGGLMGAAGHNAAQEIMK